MSAGCLEGRPDQIGPPGQQGVSDDEWGIKDGFNSTWEVQDENSSFLAVEFEAARSLELFLRDPNERHVD